MSMMIHRAVQRQRELARKVAEEEAKTPVKEQVEEKPFPKKGRKPKR